MKLDLASLKNRAAWDAAGVKLPGFDIPAIIENTKAAPTWVHFGAGNIFRGYVANLQNDLLNKGLASTGIIAVDSSDGDQLVKVYRLGQGRSALPAARGFCRSHAPALLVYDHRKGLRRQGR